MFVGVVVENFHKCQACQEKEEKLRRENERRERLEQRWKRTHLIILCFAYEYFVAEILLCVFGLFEEQLLVHYITWLSLVDGLT